MINISVALLLQISLSNCQDCSSGGCLSEMHAIIIVLSHELRGRCLSGQWVHELQPSVMHITMTTLGVASTQVPSHTDHILTIGEGWVGSTRTLVAKALALA